MEKGIYQVFGQGEGILEDSEQRTVNSEQRKDKTNSQCTIHNCRDDLRSSEDQKDRPQ